jgi:hypothetical protein
MDLGFAEQAVAGTYFGYTVALEFGGGYEMRVEVPFTLRIDGEAWTVAGPGDLKVVCGPEGELSVWSAQES